MQERDVSVDTRRLWERRKKYVSQDLEEKACGHRWGTKGAGGDNPHFNDGMAGGLFGKCQTTSDRVISMELFKKRK